MEKQLKLWAGIGETFSINDNGELTISPIAEGTVFSRRGIEKIRDFLSAALAETEDGGLVGTIPPHGRTEFTHDLMNHFDKLDGTDKVTKETEIFKTAELAQDYADETRSNDPYEFEQ